MLVRIPWTEAARPRGAEDVVLETEEGDGGEEAGPSTVAVSKEHGGKADQSISLDDNKCWLVWEGLLKDRAFSGFKAKSCPTDGAAKEMLGGKLRGYWDQAKNWKPEEEELF